MCGKITFIAGAITFAISLLALMATSAEKSDATPAAIMCAAGLMVMVMARVIDCLARIAIEIKSVMAKLFIQSQDATDATVAQSRNKTSAR